MQRLWLPLSSSGVRDEDAIMCWYDANYEYPRLEDQVSRLRKYHSAWGSSPNEVPPYRLVETCLSTLRGEAMKPIEEYLADKDFAVRRSAARIMCAAPGVGLEGIIGLQGEEGIVERIGVASWARIVLEQKGWPGISELSASRLRIKPGCVSDTQARAIIVRALKLDVTSLAVEGGTWQTGLQSRNVDVRWLAAAAALHTEGLDALATQLLTTRSRADWRSDTSAIHDILRQANVESHAHVRSVVRMVACVFGPDAQILSKYKLVRLAVIGRIQRVTNGSSALRAIAEQDSDEEVRRFAEKLVRDL
jgi:hypothetical protein